jgi:hypothetical protein
MSRFLAVSLAAAMVLAPLAGQRAPTFYSTTNIVIVNVTVLDRKGNPIENLTKGDFEIYEDGKLQKLQAVDPQHLKNDSLPPVEQELKDRLAEKPKTFNSGAG